MANWDAVRTEWETTPIGDKELAKKHGLNINTFRSRKSRDGWVRMAGIHEATVRPILTERVEVISPEVVAKIQENTRIVHRPRKDSPWLKFLPDEMTRVMETMTDVDPLDILYDQIRIQWSIILRAQEIMFVQDQLDTDRFKTSDGMESTGYEIHTSWDKHGKFMTQLSSAQKELRELIKQFMTTAPVEDERRARLINLEANTEFTQLRSKALRGATKDTSMLNVLIDAMGGNTQ